MTYHCPYIIDDLLPHTYPAILLDKVVSWHDSEIETSILIRPDIPFFKEGFGVPAHIGLEYMAQSCGAFSGMWSKTNNQPIRLGFLLGTRNFHTTSSWFLPQSTLIIHAKEIFNHDMMGCFSCNIYCNNQKIVSAELNVYQPSDSSNILNIT